MRRRGFTLLEAVVALGIAAVILAGLGGAVLRATAVGRAAAADVERQVALRALLLAIGHDVEAAVPSRDAAGPLRFTVGADGPDAPSALRLATLAGDDDVRLVSYRVEGAAGDPRDGALVRRFAARLAPPPAAEPPGDRLLGGVQRFRVRCFDGTSWTPSWSRPGLPRAVELTLAVADGRGGRDEVTMTVTPSAAGSS